MECKDAIFRLCEDGSDFFHHLCYDDVFEPKEGVQKEAYDHVHECRGAACSYFRDHILVDAFRARFARTRA